MTKQRNTYLVQVGLSDLNSQKYHFTCERTARQFASNYANQYGLLVDVYVLPPLLPHWVDGTSSKQRIATYPTR
jgi:hypothetical protein